MDFKGFRVFGLAALVLLVSRGASAAEVKMYQALTFTNGWNAVYVRVGPEESAETLFGDWPVDWVALYDPTDYAATRQFSGSSDTEGTILPGFRVWRKGERTVSSFHAVPADSVLVAYATNAFTRTIYGTPRAPRIQWHDTAAQGTANLVGLSTYGTVKAADYFSGLDVGSASFFRLLPGGPREKPTVLPLTLLSGAAGLADGQVAVVTSKRASDWSGVMNVSPAGGIDFGVSGKTGRLDVRNDSATVRTYVMKLRRGEVAPDSGETVPDLPPLFWRDEDVAVTNGEWHPYASGETLAKTVVTGGVWRLQFAVDRMKCLTPSGQLAPSGTVFAAIAEFRDVTEASTASGSSFGPSRMAAYVPVSLTVGGAEETGARWLTHGGAWPSGLWVAVAELDTVTHIGDAASYGGRKTTDVPAGGTMRVRLPILADVDESGAGDVWLLQRFTYGYDTNGCLRIYSGAYETTDEPLVDLKRFSTPFLPTDLPQIKFKAGQRFRQRAEVDFVVGENSSVNPMRHAPHPSHDGLLADYSGAAPSGDDLRNYVGTVKPEAFSITNRLSFVWDDAETAWDPSETLTGKLTWTFEGVRHDEPNQSGAIRAQGRFTMKYLTLGPVKVKR